MAGKGGAHRHKQGGGQGERGGVQGGSCSCGGFQDGARGQANGGLHRHKQRGRQGKVGGWGHGSGRWLANEQTLWQEQASLGKPNSSSMCLSIMRRCLATVYTEDMSA